MITANLDLAGAGLRMADSGLTAKANELKFEVTLTLRQILVQERGY